MFPQVEIAPPPDLASFGRASIRDTLKLVLGRRVVRHGFQIFRYQLDGARIPAGATPGKLEALTAAGLIAWATIPGEYELHVKAELTELGQHYLKGKKP